MDITINARHCKVPDSLRNQAAQRFARIERLDRRVSAATLVFEGAANERHVEARLSVAGGPPIVGHGHSPTLRGAMDDALSRLERQLKRRRDRMLDRRVRRRGGAARDLVTP